MLLFSVLLMAGGCYSFTGGSVPAHLKTLYIANVTDKSGIGNPAYRDAFMENLIRNFQRDGSLNLTETQGDARLSASITRISEQPVVVNPGELETERKVTVDVSCEYYDAVKKKQIFEKTFSQEGLYQVADQQQGRDEAVQSALTKISDDILLAVVSGW